MDADRARALLAGERERIEHALARLDRGDAEGAATQSEPGERGSEDLYESERDIGLGEDLAAQLSAVARAEARLAAGTYGVSVASGQPIPDGRLEALPSAELTVEEEARTRG